MGHFLIYRLDRPGDGLDVRLANREAHLAWADTVPEIRTGGPVFDGDRMAGSLLIVETDDPARAHAIHEDDPYTRADLWASIDIRPFRWVLGAPTDAGAA